MKALLALSFVSLLVGKKHGKRKDLGHQAYKRLDDYKHDPQWTARPLAGYNFGNLPLPIGGSNSRAFNPVPGQGYCQFVAGGGNMATTSPWPCQLLSNQVFKLTCEGELHLQAVLKFKASLLSGSVTSPLGLMDDPSYGYANVGFWDPKEAGWLYQFILTSRKTFAAYARIPPRSQPRTAETNFVAFFYLIPVANREVDEPACLQIILNKECPFVSWAVSGKEVLRVQPAGIQLDERFNIASYGGCEVEIGLPSQVQILLGTKAMKADVNTGFGAYPVCQRAVYQECIHDATDACQVACQYKDGPFTQVEPFATSLLAGFSLVYVSQYQQVITCPCDACAPEPQESSLSGCQACGDECWQERRARSPANQFRRNSLLL